MSIKRRVVAYCTKCEVHGVNMLLVPYACGLKEDDYLCVRCWTAYSLEHAQGIHEANNGAYRDQDSSPKNARKIYQAADGYKTLDGRVFGAYARRTGQKLKYIKIPL